MIIYDDSEQWAEFYRKQMVISMTCELCLQVQKKKSQNFMGLCMMFNHHIKWKEKQFCERPKSRSRWRHGCYCLGQSDLVSPRIRVEDPQSVSLWWGSAVGMRRCCQQAGTGIKGDSSGCSRELRLGIHMGQFDTVSVTPQPRWVATMSHEWRFTRKTVLIKAGHWDVPGISC